MKPPMANNGNRLYRKFLCVIVSFTSTVDENVENRTWSGCSISCMMVVVVGIPLHLDHPCTNSLGDTVQMAIQAGCAWKKKGDSSRSIVGRPRCHRRVHHALTV
jgi:hypothetical protein